MGFSGGSVVNTSNYLGNFDRLLRTQTWDLVVLSVESRDRVEIGSLGVLDPISNHIARGGALIVETWNLDEDQSALAGLLLNVCGARVEKDWHRAENYTYADFLIPAIKADSPVFSKPYAIAMPLRPTVFWPGDAGDLLRLDAPGNSKILAGVLSSDPNYFACSLPVSTAAWYANLLHPRLLSLRDVTSGRTCCIHPCQLLLEPALSRGFITELHIHHGATLLAAPKPNSGHVAPVAHVLCSSSASALRDRRQFVSTPNHPRPLRTPPRCADPRHITASRPAPWHPAEAGSPGQASHTNAGCSLNQRPR